jgi:hypothetical protein
LDGQKENHSEYLKKGFVKKLTQIVIDPKDPDAEYLRGELIKINLGEKIEMNNITLGAFSSYVREQGLNITVSDEFKKTIFKND